MPNPRLTVRPSLMRDRARSVTTPGAVLRARLPAPGRELQATQTNAETPVIARATMSELMW